MTLILLAGLLSAGGLTAMAVAYQRAPRNAQCPKCGAETEGVQTHALIRLAAPRLRIRWCSACSWEGWGRQGPEYVEGRLVAHDSGFHWGTERTPPDFGFVWNRPPVVDPPVEPPHHPSGFRFGSDDQPGPARPYGRRRSGNFGWKGEGHRRRKRAFRWKNGA